MRFSSNGAYQNPVIRDGWRRIDVGTVEEFREVAKRDFAPALFRGLRRLTGNFVCSDCLHGDVDNDGKEFTIEAFHALFCNFEYYLTTSRSHKKEKHGKIAERYHVFFPVERPYIVAEAFSIDLKILASRYAFFDTAATDAARLYFGYEETEVIYNPGVPLTIDRLPPAPEGWGRALVPTSTAVPSYVTEGGPTGFENLSSDDSYPEIDKSKLLDTLRTMARDGKFDDYYDWLRVGLAMRRSGYTVGDWLSVSKAEQDIEQAEYKWSTFGDSGKISQGTLIYIIKNGGYAVPFDVAANVAKALPNIEPEARPEDKAIIQGIPEFRYTDLGNAERFVYFTKGDFRYCPSRGESGWLYWNGKRWEWDSNKVKVQREASVIIRSIPSTAKDSTERETAFKWMMASESMRKIDAMIKIASRHEAIQISENELDANPRLIGVKNGTVDLVTGQLLAPRRDDFITRSTCVAYKADARSDVFERFLDQIFKGNSQLILYMQAFLGYCITGETNTHLFSVWFGTGKNGKSTLLDVVKMAMGDYYMTARAETFLAKDKMDGVRSDLAALAGARFVVASESDDNVTLSTAIIKEVSGGDSIRCRHLYGKEFEYKPTWKPLLVTNHKPNIKSADVGTWRRLSLVPFDFEVSDEDMDRDLPAKLEQDVEAVLAFMVYGARTWYDSGMPRCIAVETSTREYQEAEDEIGQFISDRMVIRANARIGKKELYDAFIEWARDNGWNVMMKQKTFFKKIEERKFKSHRFPNAICFVGLGMRAAPGDEKAEEVDAKECPF